MNGTEVKRPSAAAGLTILGGVAMAIGAILPFAKVEAGELPIPSQTVGGLDTADGKLFLGVGIALIVLGVLIWMARSRGLRVVAAVLALLAAGFMLYAAIIDITGIEDESLDAIAEAGAAQTAGVSVEQVRDALDQFNVSVKTGIGLYIVLVGSAIGAVGGLLGLLAKRPEPVMPAAPPPPGPPPPPMEPTGP
ncbi:MAG TPA: hypothetical protein VFH75_07215 [Actinomycetota bacterium]|nr:hypothetical protein [Actinomycetota bacterium]